jgi:serine/threonine protein kinase
MFLIYLRYYLNLDLIENKLGEGPWGFVHTGSVVSSGEKVALKFYDLNKCDDINSTIKTNSNNNLKSPYTIVYTEDFMYEKYHCVVMKLIDGSLDFICQSHPDLTNKFFKFDNQVYLFLINIHFLGYSINFCSNCYGHLCFSFSGYCTFQFEAAKYTNHK